MKTTTTKVLLLFPLAVRHNSVMMTSLEDLRSMFLTFQVSSDSPFWFRGLPIHRYIPSSHSSSRAEFYNFACRLPRPRPRLFKGLDLELQKRPSNEKQKTLWFVLHVFHVQRDPPRDPARQATVVFPPHSGCRGAGGSVPPRRCRPERDHPPWKTSQAGVQFVSTSSGVCLFR